MLRHALRHQCHSPSASGPRLPKRYISNIEPSSAQHSSLPSFLVHARTTGLSPRSSVYTGTLYEYLCLETLASPAYGFSLTRVGQRNDAGVDLIGEWTPPVTLPTKDSNGNPQRIPFPLRVLIQCKSSRNKLSPNVVRELEGCVAGAPAGWRGENTLAVLCAKRQASKGVRDAVRDAGMGVVWIMIEEGQGDQVLEDTADYGDGDKEATTSESHDDNQSVETDKRTVEEIIVPKGHVRQMLWNQRAANAGLEAVRVGMKFVRDNEKNIGREVRLMGIDGGSIML